MKRLIILLLALGAVMPVAAQQDCGNGLPCGSIPWPQPNPPQLKSPTPMPTIGVTVNPPTQTPGGATATPTPTSVSSDIDTQPLNDQFATLQALVEATEQVVEVSGTPVTASGQLDALASDSYQFFGYVRAVADFDLGGLTPLLGFVILSLITVISVKLITFILPVLGAVWAFLKSIVDFVLNLLPF